MLKMDVKNVQNELDVKNVKNEYKQAKTKYALKYGKEKSKVNKCGRRVTFIWRSTVT